MALRVSNVMCVYDRCVSQSYGKDVVSQNYDYLNIYRQKYADVRVYSVYIYSAGKYNVDDAVRVLNESGIIMLPLILHDLDAVFYRNKCVLQSLYISVYGDLFEFMWAHTKNVLRDMTTGDTDITLRKKNKVSHVLNPLVLIGFHPSLCRLEEVYKNHCTSFKKYPSYSTVPSPFLGREIIGKLESLTF